MVGLGYLFLHFEFAYDIIIALVAVAQLAERRPVEANVAGSNPVSHPFDKLRVNPCSMPIKPLEKKPARSALLKVLFLVTLVASGILLDKIFLKKKQDIPSILGKTQEIKLQTQEKLIKKIQESNLINDSIKKAEEVGGVVLGEAASTLNKLTSNAGSFVSDIIYDNSIGKVIEQIDKLPKDQQEKIKEQICK